MVNVTVTKPQVSMKRSPGGSSTTFWTIDLASNDGASDINFDLLDSLIVNAFKTVLGHTPAPVSPQE